MKVLLATSLLAAFPATGFAQNSQAPAPKAPAKIQTQEKAPAPVILTDQITCPISGDEIDKSIFTDYEGQRVYFCCKKCVEKFNRFPDGYLYSMYKKGERPENIQTTCPVSGKKLESKEFFVQVMNKRIYTCCAKCIKKVEANPALYLDKLEGRKPQTACPISGDPVEKDTFTLVQGQKVYFCCPGCDKKFEAEPERFFDAFAKAGVVAESANEFCPVSQEEHAEPDVFVTYKGRRIHFCCWDCVKPFSKNPDKYLASL